MVQPSPTHRRNNLLAEPWVGQQEGAVVALSRNFLGTAEVQVDRIYHPFDVSSSSYLYHSAPKKDRAVNR